MRPEQKAAADLREIDDIAYIIDQEDAEAIIARANAAHYLPMLRVVLMTCASGAVCDLLRAEIAALEAAGKEG